MKLHGVPPDRIPVEAFRWLADANILAKSPSLSEGDVDALQTQLLAVLKVLAEHPDGQSKAIRTALGSLVQNLIAHEETYRIVTMLTQELLKHVETKHPHKYSPMKHLAITTLGSIASIPRQSYRHLSANIFTALTDSLLAAKSNSLNLAGYRHCVLLALTNAARVAGTAIDPAAMRQVWRLARHFVSDSSYLVSAQAFKLLAVLGGPVVVDTRKRFERVYSLYIKGIASPHPSVRSAAAQFFAQVVTSIDAVSRDREAPEPGVELPPASDAKVTRQEVFRSQCTYYCLPSTSEHSANGVIEYMAFSFKLMGPANILQEFPKFGSHLMYLPALLQSRGNRYDAAVDHVFHLIVDVIVGEVMQTEQDRLLVAEKTLQVLATTPADKQVMAAQVVECLAGAIALLGGAATPLIPAVIQACSSLLAASKHWSLTVSLLKCLAKVTEVLPENLMPLLEQALNSLDEKPTIKYSYLVAILTSQCPKNMAYMSVDISARTFEKALELIKLGQFNAQSQCGWILLEGIMVLDSRVIKLYVPLLLSTWEAWLVAWPETKQNGDIQAHLAARVPAISALAAFLVLNRSLLTNDVLHKVAKILNPLWNFVESHKSRDELKDASGLIRRRLFLCYKVLAEQDHGDIYPASLLVKVAGYITTGEQATSAGAFSSLRFDIDQAILQGTPKPVQQAVIELGISMMAKVLPFQPPRVQESILDGLRSRSSLNPENVLQLMHESIQYALTDKIAASSYRDPRIFKIWADIAFDSLSTPLILPRRNAAAAAGLLAAVLADQPSIAAHAKRALDLIDSSGSSVVRSGAALALGKIVHYASSKFTASSLSTIYGVLEQLCRDPNPLVHSWAIESASLVVTELGIHNVALAGRALLSFTELYCLETHSDECGDAIMSNLELKLPESTMKQIAKGTASIISSIGPDLTVDEQLLREAYRLIDQFQSPSQKPDVVAEAWRNFQEIFFYAEDRIEWRGVIKKWSHALDATEPLLSAASQGLNLFLRNMPDLILKLEPDLETHLWLAYDLAASPAVRELLLAWLEYLPDSQRWITRLLLVFNAPKSIFTTINGSKAKYRLVEQTSLGDSGTKTAARRKKNNVEEDDESLKHEHDHDEDQSLGGETVQEGTEPLSWHTRVLALEMLCRLIKTDLEGKPAVVRLHSHVAKNVGDLIKTAFTAATSQVIALRLNGIKLLQNLVRLLGDLADPDIPECSYLEQYTVQISSALTPVFEHESPPELVLAALEACGVYAASGIARSIDKLERITKLLAESLESGSSTELKIGKVKFSPNAAAQVRVGLLRFWAILQCSGKLDLVSLVEPHEEKLIQLWSNALSDYAQLRFEPEEVSVTTFNDAMGRMRAVLLRQVILPTLQTSWLDMVSAIAVTIKMRGIEALKNSPGQLQGEDFTFVLVGMCFEALILRTTSVLPVLEALQRIVQTTSGAFVIYNQDTFDEVVDTLERITLTGSPPEQQGVIKIARSLIKGRVESDDNVDELFRVLKIMVMPLSAQFPMLSGVEIFATNQALSDQNIEVIQTCLMALVDSVQVFREVIRNDLLLSLLWVFETIFLYPSCQSHVVPHIIGSFKTLLDFMKEACNSNGETRLLFADAICSFFASIQPGTEINMSNDGDLNRVLILTAVVCTHAPNLEPAARNILVFGQHVAKLLATPGSKVAAECMWAIFNATKGQNIGKVFAQGCIPEVINQVKNEIQENVRLLCDLLVAWAGADGSSLSFGVVVPTMLAMSRSREFDTDNHFSYIRSQLLSLAEKYPDVFKEVVHAAVPADRGALQRFLMSDRHSGERIDIPLTSFGNKNE